MKLSQLSYAVQREYTIPYLPHVFYAASFLILCILILLNVALTGSDIVTTLRNDPYAVERAWWMPRFWPEFLIPPIADICQPQSIADDPTLRTNSSVPLFKYALRYANVAGGGSDPSNRIYPVPYMANPLTSCEVETILWRVDVPIRIMSYQATISCSLEGKKTFGSIRVPDDITLSMTHHRTWNTDLGPDDVKDHFAFNVVPQSRDGNNGYKLKPTQSLRTLPANSSSPNNVLAVLDGMQSDLFHAIWTQKSIWVLNNLAHYDTYIIEWAASNGSYCWSGEDYDAQCGNATDLNRVLRWYGTTKDWGNGSNRAAFIQPFQVSIINSLIALRDAIMIDLGNANPTSNIYLNKTYFNEVIRLDPFHSDSTATMLNTTDNYNLTEADYWNFCSWWNCINTSWAQAFREAAEDSPVRNITLPYRPTTPQAKSVFSFGYLCPTFQRKPITSLLLSVFVEDRHEDRPLVQRGYTRDSSNTLYDSPGVGSDKGRVFDYEFTPTKGGYGRVDSNSYSYSVPEFDPYRRSYNGQPTKNNNKNKRALSASSGSVFFSWQPSTQPDNFGMKIPPLEYPVQQKYTIPHLARYFYAIAFVLLCFFALLNVVLVGSDVVTVTKTDPTALEDVWWMPNFWPKQLRLSLPQRCEPVSLTSDTPLRTNSTLSFFSYILRRANAGRTDADPSRRVYPVPYIANQLSGCEVGTISWRMDLPEIIVSYKAVVHCTLESRREFDQVKVPANITLSVNHRRSLNMDWAPDDLVDYLAFDVAPESKSSGVSKLDQVKPMLSLPANSTSPINVLGVLHGLQYDFFRAVWAQLVLAELNNTAVPNSGAHSQTYIAEWVAGPAGVTGCWSKTQSHYSESCGSVTDQRRIVRDYGSSDRPGSPPVDANFMEPFPITRINIFIALRDAILLDLGNADTQTNIYLNKTYFNQVIQVDPFHDKARSYLLERGAMISDDWAYCSWWGCSNTTWAQSFRDATEDNPVANLALPYKPEDPQSPVVFSFNYLCPTFQRKDISSLLTSIFVATATTLGVLNSLFGFVMPQVEEWYKRRKQRRPQVIGANMDNHSDVHPIALRPRHQNLDDNADSESESGDYKKRLRPEDELNNPQYRY